jgi:hypothetical protein
MQATWRVYLVSGLVACVVSALTALVAVRLLAPSPAQSPNSAQSSNTVILEGAVDVPHGTETAVFYKTPFAAPPNLTFPEGLDFRLQVTDQQAGSFKLKGVGGVSPAKVKWKAEGQPAK